jgi:hypothetical protein
MTKSTDLDKEKENRLQPTIKELFDNALSVFENDGKQIDGVYDLLVRGGASKEEHMFVPNWSDLDLSIIVESVNSKILNQIQALYQKIKVFFPYKLSLTVVSKKDFFSKYHHHGIKPIYYSYQLAASISLLRGNVSVSNLIKLRDRQLDCLGNVAYLIHDLRSSFLKLDNTLELTSFFCHLLKRAKQLIRNSLFVLTGSEEEEIDLNLFKKYFPDVNPDFPLKLKKYKKEFNLYDSSDEIKIHINNIFDILENIYAHLITYLETQSPFEVTSTTHINHKEFC